MDPQSSLAFSNFTKMNYFSDGELDIRLGKVPPERYYSNDQKEIDSLAAWLSHFVDYNLNFEESINKKYDSTFSVNQLLAQTTFTSLTASPIFIWDWFQVNSYDILVRHLKTKPASLGNIIELHNHINFFDAVVLKSLSRLIRNRPIIQATPQSTQQVSHIPNESFDSVVLISDSLIRIPAMIEKLSRSLFLLSDSEYLGFTKAMKGKGNFGGLRKSRFSEKLKEKSAFLFKEMGNRRNDEVHDISELPTFLDDKNRVISETDAIIELYKHFQMFYLLALAVVVENYH